MAPEPVSRTRESPSKAAEPPAMVLPMTKSMGRSSEVSVWLAVVGDGADRPSAAPSLGCFASRVAGDWIARVLCTDALNEPDGTTPVGAAVKAGRGRLGGAATGNAASDTCRRA